MSRTRLAVLGSPIAHSKSPAIHRAATAVLGLDWEYGSAEVTGDALPAYLDGLDGTWRGLSLTMPLKRDVLPLLDGRDPLVESVGAANTVLLTDDGRHGFNTDVGGVVSAFREAGVERLDRVLILGGGATAASVIAGIAELGAADATVAVRTPANAAPLVPLGERVGVRVAVTGIQEIARDTPSAVVSTVPGGADLLSFRDDVRERSPLFDVAYDPWPTPLAASWRTTVISGFDLLVHQAIGQLRVFVHGDPGMPLADEPAVLAAMRAAL
jgi:shikimate dehydrogenase